MKKQYIKLDASDEKKKDLFKKEKSLLEQMAKIRIRTHANPLSYPEPVSRNQWDGMLKTEQPYICLDMGCGQGDFIIASAQKYPEKYYVGIEVRKAMCNKVNEKIEKAGVTNAVCVQGNASISLKTMFVTGEVNEIVINFPDPWFKEKHKKRLMIQEQVVLDMKEVLTEQGIIYLQTDVEELFSIFKTELEKEFLAKPYPEGRVQSYWEKHHTEKGTMIHRSMFVKK